MNGRTLGIALLILISAAGGVHCSSAETESSVPVPPASVAGADSANDRVAPGPPITPIAALASSSAPASRPTASANSPTSAPDRAVSPDADLAPAVVANRAPVPHRPLGPPLAAVSDQAEGETGEAARVRQEIAFTDRFLAAVRKKVGRSFNKKARQDFVVAMGRQREARESLDESFYARADRLTLEAREMARQIAYRRGPPREDPDYVAMTLDRTDDAIKRAREVVSNGGDAGDRRRMDALAEAQKEARRRFKDSDVRGAYDATRKVRDGVLDLLKECDDLPVPAATAERALKRAQRALERAAPELGDRRNDAARRWEREAREQMARAQAAFARKNYRDTLLHSKLVERNLDLAVAAQRSATNRSG